VPRTEAPQPTSPPRHKIPNPPPHLRQHRHRLPSRPPLGRAVLVLGQAALREGDFTAARELFIRCVKAAPASTAVGQAVAHLLLSTAAASLDPAQRERLVNGLLRSTPVTSANRGLLWRPGWRTAASLWAPTCASCWRKPWRAGVPPPLPNWKPSPRPNLTARWRPTLFTARPNSSCL
jgi:hypothetical protein